MGEWQPVEAAPVNDNVPCEHLNYANYDPDRAEEGMPIQVFGNGSVKCIDCGEVVLRLRRADDRRDVKESDLISQTHQAANNSVGVDNYWLGPNGEIEPATFLLGDLCTWDYEARGFKLMRDKRRG